VPSIYRGNGEVIEGIERAVLENPLIRFGETALLDRRNGTSRAKKCRFSLNEEIG
jgi:hypothetical protein